MKLKILKIKIKNQTKNYRQLKKIYRNKLIIKYKIKKINKENIQIMMMK